MGRAEALGIQCGSNLIVQLTLGCHLPDALLQGVQVGILCVGLNTPNQPMFAHRPGLPVDLKPHFTLGPPLVEDHLLDEETYNLFTVSVGRCGRVPDSGQVLGKRQDVLPICRRQFEPILLEP